MFSIKTEIKQDKDKFAPLMLMELCSDKTLGTASLCLTMELREKASRIFYGGLAVFFSWLAYG
jgi:hypothetical protein